MLDAGVEVGDGTREGYMVAPRVLFMAGVTDLISPFALVPLGCCHWGGIGLPVGVTPAVAAYEGDADMMCVCVCASVCLLSLPRVRQSQHTEMRLLQTANLNVQGKESMLKQGGKAERAMHKAQWMYTHPQGTRGLNE